MNAESILKIKKPPLLFICFLLITILMALSVRGLPGNPTAEELNSDQWKEYGPLELSPERGRYALAYSVVENKSLFFSLPLARFVTPDLGINPEGKYVSLFAPGVSFLVIPGYLIGRFFNAAQVGAFAVIAIFALLNVLLIMKIVKRLGADAITGLLAGIFFLFATPAYAYAVTLYQHHFSVFIILLAIYLLLCRQNFWSLTLIWLLCGLSIAVDNPNVILMFPLGIVALGQFISVKAENNNIGIKLHIIKILSFFGMIVPLLLLSWFNQSSHGNAFKLSGTLPSVSTINAEGKPVHSDLTANLYLAEFSAYQEKTAIGFFKTRNLLNGFYIHLLSPDRGLINFSPLMILGVWGLVILYKRDTKFTALLVSIISLNVVLYSLWGDPWGGWAFGSRYLIPTYAILSIGLGLLIFHYRQSVIMMALLLILFAYSVSINSLGALTSNMNPPQIEILSLEKASGHEEKYTAARNWQYLNNRGSKSFAYQAVIKGYLHPVNFYYLLTELIISLGSCLLFINGKDAIKNLFNKNWR